MTANPLPSSAIKMARRIATLLRGKRLRLDNEKLLQAQVAEVLAVGNIDAVREVRLAPGDVIDLLAGEVGIEIKIKGQRRAIYRQCERYCGHEAIEALILITNAAMGMPASINGKPVFVVSLGTGWLG